VPVESALAAELEPLRPPPEPPLAHLVETLHREAARGGDSELGNLTADAMLAELGAQVVLLNGSSLRADLEAGPLLRSDLELAFPFHEPWRVLWSSGAELRAGLGRALAHAASRGCESPLQVAGLRLLARCRACADRQPDCLDVELGGRALEDVERLLVALPAYLAQPGADFAPFSRFGSEVSVDVIGALARKLSRASNNERERDACVAELLGWPLARCREAFGAALCPLDEAQARGSCEVLPAARGGLDDRIRMSP
jgi:2',3'-cyclic-nucleotide 2'-phosphodiesterase (5'-nucleotidase family)